MFWGYPISGLPYSVGCARHVLRNPLRYASVQAYPIRALASFSGRDVLEPVPERPRR
jgi:hypothetical protein